MEDYINGVVPIAYVLKKEGMVATGKSKEASRYVSKVATLLRDKEIVTIDTNHVTKESYCSLVRLSNSKYTTIVVDHNVLHEINNPQQVQNMLAVIEDFALNNVAIASRVIVVHSVKHFTLMYEEFFNILNSREEFSGMGRIYVPNKDIERVLSQPNRDDVLIIDRLITPVYMYSLYAESKSTESSYRDKLMTNILTLVAKHAPLNENFFGMRDSLSDVNAMKMYGIKRLMREMWRELEHCDLDFTTLPNSVISALYQEKALANNKITIEAVRNGISDLRKNKSRYIGEYNLVEAIRILKRTSFK